jgi:predicted O-linked N-acetylglucosamine transferase (SPINDLY family)
MPEVMQAAIEHPGGGRLGAAARLYRQVLAENPNNAEAAYLVGVLALESQRLEVAVEMFTRATTLAPHNAASFANLGEALRRLRRFGLAVDAFIKAMAIKPDLVAPVYNLGLLLLDIREFDGAIACLERAAELDPKLPDIQRQIAGAREGQRQRGKKRDKSQDSLTAARFVGLAESVANLGHLDQAIFVLRRAIEVHPEHGSAHGNLGSLLSDLHRNDEAIVSFRKALEIDPNDFLTHNNLGNTLSKMGLLDEAIASYRRALAINAQNDVHSNLLFALHFHPGYDAGRILEEARDWDRRYAQELTSKAAPHENDRTPDRRLRIGYVSPDFRQHCQSFFLFPVLSSHDHANFEIFCYSNVLKPDEWTGRLLGLADQWRSIVAMDDEAAAGQIRADRIDVLVDLTMHMERNRLGIFARKPAPVQVSWLAYPGTTGLSAMDYRVTDPFLDPPEADPGAYAERPLRLPEAFWCYHPLTSENRVSPLPATTRGHVQLGCLNSLYKVNAAVIALWARVMRGIPSSRITVLCPPGDASQRLLAAFETHGIDRARIDLVGRASRLQYLARYREIDVCLDTFPYNGHTTSLDAFWMGVPVVTLVGSTVVGRAGLCQATHLGLPELVARTEDEYVKIAIDLCGDLERLAQMRAGLRERIEKSPLMDAPRFARNLEAGYRAVWREWCERPR